MKLSDFNYNLPKNLIAQKPVKPRDRSRLLIMERKSGRLSHKYFYNILDYLKKGDVLVLNNSKVMPARLIGKKVGTGGKVEVFLLRKTDLTPTLSLARRGRKNPPYPPLLKGAEVWQCLIGGKKRKPDMRIEFGLGLKADILKNNNEGASASLSTGTWLVKFNKKGNELMKVVNKIGRVPVPPYIKRTRDSIASLQNDKVNYQTVYADNKKAGSVAAPTAGLHFTSKLLKKIKARGVEVVYITLHVGLGTFAPVKVDDIKKHKMHSEFVQVPADAIKRIINAKREERRIVAVGTTSVRTLESVFNQLEIRNWKLEIRNMKNNKTKKNIKKIKNFHDWVNIFIYPGYKFKVVDAMITNFHLPKSTLLMLVMAFSSRKNILKAYKSAIRKKYRFYSYGDAMMIY